MSGRAAVTILLGLVVGACGGRPAQDAPPGPPAPVEALITPPAEALSADLPAEVVETRDTILAASDARSLRRLGRFADAQDAFLSNLGEDDHYDHWFLLRATGFDVLRELDALFEEPYATRRVGTETWYVWPDLAALGDTPLELERLSFRDRARLEALIGPEGIAEMQAGAPYPGIRPAISETGQWRYFFHESGETETQDE